MFLIRLRTVENGGESVRQVYEIYFQVYLLFVHLRGNLT